MPTGDSFDSRPDPVLGEALRHHLSGGPPDATFAALVRARLASESDQWEVLARWARPRIAAAVLAAALLGYWAVIRQSDAGQPEVVGELAATDRPLDGETLMSDLLGTGQ